MRQRDVLRRRLERERVAARSSARSLYDAEQRGELPDAAVLASLGCGNPTAVADLHEGETVLDLGSGGGIDVILSARRVGPTGIAYGLDMTDEMLALAQNNATEAGVSNVHFLKGVIEQIPLPANSVDVVISNCVINLSVDKPAVLTEMARVLRPADASGSATSSRRITSRQPNERSAAPTSAASPARSRRTSTKPGSTAAGFEQVSVEFTHQVADGMHGAIVKAVKTEEPHARDCPSSSRHAGGVLLTERALLRACVAELIGTFALVFAGAGAVMVDAKTGALGHVGVAITFGLVIMVMIYARRARLRRAFQPGRVVRLRGHATLSLDASRALLARAAVGRAARRRAAARVARQPRARRRDASCRLERAVVRVGDSS